MGSIPQGCRPRARWAHCEQRETAHRVSGLGALGAPGHGWPPMRCRQRQLWGGRQRIRPVASVASWPGEPEWGARPRGGSRQRSGRARCFFSQRGFPAFWAAGQKREGRWRLAGHLRERGRAMQKSSLPSRETVASNAGDGRRPAGPAPRKQVREGAAALRPRTRNPAPIRARRAPVRDAGKDLSAQRTDQPRHRRRRWA